MQCASTDSRAAAPRARQFCDAVANTAKPEPYLSALERNRPGEAPPDQRRGEDVSPGKVAHCDPGTVARIEIDPLAWGPCHRNRPVLDFDGGGANYPITRIEEAVREIQLLAAVEQRLPVHAELDERGSAQCACSAEVRAIVVPVENSFVAAGNRGAFVEARRRVDDPKADHRERRVDAKVVDGSRDRVVTAKASIIVEEEAYLAARALDASVSATGHTTVDAQGDDLDPRELLLDRAGRPVARAIVDDDYLFAR